MCRTSAIDFVFSAFMLILVLIVMLRGTGVFFESVHMHVSHVFQQNRVIVCSGGNLEFN